MAIFITGTDTNIGKTLISAWICKNLKCDYWKPIQSGELDNSDSNLVDEIAGVKIHPEAYRFAEALSPHDAARISGVSIDPKNIIMPPITSLVIEGAGGLMVPINEQHLMIDLIASLAAPVLIVARGTLGTINHTCLTVQALRSRNIPIIGVIISGPIHSNNRFSIEKYCGAKVLFEFPQLKEITSSSVAEVIMPQNLKTGLAKWL